MCFAADEQFWPCFLSGEMSNNYQRTLLIKLAKKTFPLTNSYCCSLQKSKERPTIFIYLFLLPCRYMMLINGKDEVYMLDRDNTIFHIANLEFPFRKDPRIHLANTLLDGVSSCIVHILSHQNTEIHVLHHDVHSKIQFLMLQFLITSASGVTLVLSQACLH